MLQGEKILSCSSYQKYYFFVISYFMKSSDTFHMVDCVDSSNNYAMEQVHAGLAGSGMAWLAKEQQSGKGQRGKGWESQPGANITMSVAFVPPKAFWPQPFLWNALIANTCRQFLSGNTDHPVTIKWPNDLYIDDRKAGGILIENSYQGQSWSWSIVGIGINVNQTSFPSALPNPVSLQQLTQSAYNVPEMAKQLHLQLIHAVEHSDAHSILWEDYQQHLYKRYQQQKLRKANAVFETQILGVNQYGQLLTKDTLGRAFSFGEVEWIL